MCVEKERDLEGEQNRVKEREREGVRETERGDKVGWTDNAAE